jgi:hypothetical protein
MNGCPRFSQIVARGGGNEDEPPPAHDLWKGAVRKGGFSMADLGPRIVEAEAVGRNRHAIALVREAIAVRWFCDRA